MLSGKFNSPAFATGRWQMMPQRRLIKWRSPYGDILKIAYYRRIVTQTYVRTDNAPDGCINPLFFP